jgi:hypothetical protein
MILRPMDWNTHAVLFIDLAKQINHEKIFVCFNRPVRTIIS